MLFKFCQINQIRMYSSSRKLNRVLPSTVIRKTFLEYFTENHEHKFVRSSPVIPLCDPTVAFVNAGMNQFKSVFLGKTVPPSKRVVNSQKCVRVGGKHNDLSVVGQDGYHHTFFEMLGNWSFGDYFKKEACQMALELLKGPYGIDQSRLYVTYFAGDKALGLPADTECFEIWRSLGFPAERILPFGSRDNFWEMGSTGPCGPCTEIHIDHKPELSATEDRAKLVNAGRPDLTELWNIVFIQYNRSEDGTIEQLPEKHVDTGMGFERLTAILQNKSSNYDTDLFSPIFETTQRLCKVPGYGGLFPTPTEKQSLDTGYRILADHSRMITACIADGMLPDQNQKLRRVLRKAILTSENIFNNANLLPQLIPVVVDTLGSAYPEMNAKLSDVLEIIAHEQDVFKTVRSSSSKAFNKVLQQYPKLQDVDLMEFPGFVPAFKDLQAQKSIFKDGVIPGKFLFKLTDTFGLAEDSFKILAQLEGMQLDEEGFREEVIRAKEKSKGSNFDSTTQRQINEALSKLTLSCENTDSSFRYNYKFNTQKRVFEVPPVETVVLGILQSDCQVDSVNADTENHKDLISVVTSKSNFYYEAGGQPSDKGYIEFDGGKFVVENVIQMNDCIVHVGRFKEPGGTLSVGSKVVLHVDSDYRTANTCHHTAIHLLNGAVRSLFKKVTYQVTSSVSGENCKLELGIIGKRMGKEEIQEIEHLIRNVIQSAIPSKISLVNAADVIGQSNITLVPGEIYPETGLRLITIENKSLSFLSNELCCGTHVLNTSDLENFVITNLKQTNRARYAFTAAAGKLANNATIRAEEIKSRVDSLEREYKTNSDTLYATEIELQKIRNNILHSDIVLPYVFRVDILNRINEILKQLKKTSRTSLKVFVEDEMKTLLQEKPIEKYPFIIHYLSSSALLEEVPLQKATQLCNDRPILLVSMCDGVVKARCCVPKEFVTDSFNAQNWLQLFASVFEAQLSTPKSQDSNEVCNMKGKKVSSEFDDKLEVAINKCREYAANKLS
ncbi:alanine--tRNA ligase, mitochondrial [Episyrphus balteatus]|uniref:alanine--tRNA ligase, mitochondrial n=1 Tax=Episyrphus balteatus TaxID=286459 RepID=UPI00248667FB|nr:alanine--tRNA ligase, mitochondrial [Episyrphus balteatus]